MALLAANGTQFIQQQQSSLPSLSSQPPLQNEVFQAGAELMKLRVNSNPGTRSSGFINNE